MVLGTASGVGKSVIAAGLCRILSNWGYQVAPFKAQNMSNNSYVTEAGGEMGRAQVVQAECARLNPHTDMNPVLLKPAADNHSQVVLQGKALGHFAARNYYAQRDLLLEAVHQSYERLAAKYEIIILEGAGSPAEVNLKRNDFVNLEMAKFAGASCVLVGDIDRGGVFASLCGTLDLLDGEERNLVTGLVINKFRGDRTLLDDGLEFLEKRTQKKIWGVVPYDHGLWIEEEDSLPVETFPAQSVPEEELDLAVILLPRMSNFTDFEILKSEAGVRVRYVRKARELGRPDLLILPGTKATMADLRHLMENGFYEKILDFVEKGGRMLGICGGYQMMGKKLLDPEGVESGLPEMEGLGFFNMTSRFSSGKILRRISTSLDLPLFGGRVAGEIDVYEIHMGKTIHHENYPPMGPAGAIHPSGRLAGTYYHGLFESAGFRQSFLEALSGSLQKKTTPCGVSRSAKELKEAHYERWAAHLSTHLNLDYLRQCLHLSSPSYQTF